VTAALLETRALCRNFGALAAARDIDFRLEVGARHALIGPNGAGKTTFVNLLTGVVVPTSGAILLKGRDITRVDQAQRVKLGIARTFQINRLFRRLSVLENVYIAVAERLGAAPSMLRPAGGRSDVVEEAMQLLETLRLTADAGRRIADLPYGRQRLVEIAIALGLRPEVLLLDEPAAGVPSAESHIILDAIDGLPKDIGVLIIDHDMDLVFRFARRITVMVSGAARSAPTRTSAPSTSGRPSVADALALRGVSAGYGETVVLEDIDLALAPGESISVIGRNGVGKTTLLATVMGHTTLHAGEVTLGGVGLGRVPIFRRARRGLGWVPQEREIFPSLSVRENLTIAARPGHWTLERVFELFPNLGARLSNMGNQLSGGEQQMLSIARALLTNPSVLLMDEPTEGLAPVIVEALAEVLQRLRREGVLSIVLVEQNSRVALAFSPRTVVMDKGRIVYDGESVALNADPERLAGLIGVA
jgi:branched-chain amino acid transport system ATP-binding protein